MKRFKKILVATDTRLEQHAVVDKAAEIAVKNHAALAIVDVVPEISWIASKLVSDLEHMRELYAQEVAAKLDSLAAPLRDRGIDVTTRVLAGKTSVEVVREVLREKHDLLMVVAKGKNSKRKGFFGYTAVHLLQTCPSAVWLVHYSAIQPNRRSTVSNVHCSRSNPTRSSAPLNWEATPKPLQPHELGMQTRYNRSNSFANLHGEFDDRSSENGQPHSRQCGTYQRGRRGVGKRFGAF